METLTEEGQGEIRTSTLIIEIGTETEIDVPEEEAEEAVEAASVEVEVHRALIDTSSVNRCSSTPAYCSLQNKF